MKRQVRKCYSKKITRNFLRQSLVLLFIFRNLPLAPLLEQCDRIKLNDHTHCHTSDCQYRVLPSQARMIAADCRTSLSHCTVDKWTTTVGNRAQHHSPKGCCRLALRGPPKEPTRTVIITTEATFVVTSWLQHASIASLPLRS